MNWKSLIVGVAVGVTATVAIKAHADSRQPKIAEDETITFSDKIFFDSAKTGIGDGQITLSGTIVGDHVGYKNNTLTASCTKSTMKCQVASVRQIGRDQVDEIDIEQWDITNWSPIFVSAQNTGPCGSTTININRQNEEVGYVIVPANLSSPLCNKTDPHVYQWSIGRSLFWSRTSKRP